MRRYGAYALMMFCLSVTAGCSYVPNFPDLWPFNDEPGTPAELSQLDPVTAAADADSAAPAPSAEVALASPQPTPAPAGIEGGITASAPGAAAYIIAPADGAVVTNPVRVLFGLDRMGVAPATLVQEATGHHHLLIDTALPALDLPIPVDDNHRHFSGGQTETSLNLPIGQHTLQLLMGDHTHTPHRPPIFSQKITITVQ